MCIKLSLYGMSLVPVHLYSTMHTFYDNAPHCDDNNYKVLLYNSHALLQHVQENLYLTGGRKYQPVAEKLKPCWYCTNLTSLDVCDVCGNKQRKV